MSTGRPDTQRKSSLHVLGRATYRGLQEHRILNAQLLGWKLATVGAQEHRKKDAGQPSEPPETIGALSVSPKTRCISSSRAQASTRAYSREHGMSIKSTKTSVVVGPEVLLQLLQEVVRRSTSKSAYPTQVSISEPHRRQTRARVLDEGCLEPLWQKRRERLCNLENDLQLDVAFAHNSISH
jgi:hypothetical protein